MEGGGIRPLDIGHDVLAVGEGIETMQTLRWLYVARDADGAGDRALAALTGRAEAAGIEALALSPRMGDFNHDLRAFGLFPQRACSLEGRQSRRLHRPDARTRKRPSRRLRRSTGVCATATRVRRTPAIRRRPAGPRRRDPKSPPPSRDRERPNRHIPLAGNGRRRRPNPAFPSIRGMSAPTAPPGNLRERSAVFVKRRRRNAFLPRPQTERGCHPP